MFDNKKYHNTCVKRSIYEKLKVLARKRGKTLNGLLEEIVNPFFEIGVDMKAFNIEITSSVLGRSVQYQLCGPSNLIIGSMSESELANLKHRLFEKAKADRAKVKQKQ
jgi:hypothetical protein